jgi:hypothetical protein
MDGLVKEKQKEGIQDETVSPKKPTQEISENDLEDLKEKITETVKNKESEEKKIREDLYLDDKKISEMEH